MTTASITRSTITVPKMAAPGAPVSRATYHARRTSPTRSGKTLLAMKPTAWPRKSVPRSIGFTASTR